MGIAKDALIGPQPGQSKRGTKWIPLKSRPKKKKPPGTLEREGGKAMMKRRCFFSLFILPHVTFRRRVTIDSETQIN
jgi:hypothetical protein